MKLKPLPDHSIDSFEGRSIDEAFAHFIHSWYHLSGEVHETAEIKHAFFSGAAYLQNLVARSRDLPQNLRMELVGTLFLDMSQTLSHSGQRAYNATNPTILSPESSDPSI
jgi:hypothetical protein